MICCAATATFYLILFFLQWSAISLVMKMDFSRKSAASLESLMNFIVIDALLLFATLLTQFIFWQLMLKTLPNGPIKQSHNNGVVCMAVAGILFFILVSYNMSKGSSAAIDNSSMRTVIQIGLNLLLIGAYSACSYSIQQAANLLKPKSVNTLFACVLGAMLVRVICLLLAAFPSKVQLYADVAHSFFAAVSLILIAVLVWTVNNLVQRTQR